MSARQRVPFPTAPDLPRSFDQAPDELNSRDLWDEVEADEHVRTAEWVADAQLRGSVWKRGQLVGRRFTGLVCDDMSFIGCDLAGASLQDARLTRVRFESCRMNGVILAGATLLDVELVDSVVDLVDLRMAHVRRTSVQQCTLRDADFYSCALADVRFTGCDLAAANFENAATSGIDLRGSSLEGLRGASALAAARISPDQVVSVGAALMAELGFRVD
jgi:uncharacterized protein YjbI with pentapeptide repeats